MNLVIQLYDKDSRAAAEQKVSDALGSFVDELQKPNFGDWSPEEWRRFCAVAFDVVASDACHRRVTVHGPKGLAAPF